MGKLKKLITLVGCFGLFYNNEIVFDKSFSSAYFVLVIVNLGLFIPHSSNIPEEKKLQFELVMGQTEQTNKWHTFVLEPEADSAYIKLGNHLDYEKITDYTLTVRIQVIYTFY